MFSTGFPGAGLLVMRLVAGSIIITGAITRLPNELPSGAAAISVVQILLGCLLIGGWRTTTAASLAAILEIVNLFRHPGNPWVHILLATFGVALALLGPGAWSVDAHRFGWRRVRPLQSQSQSQSPIRG